MLNVWPDLGDEMKSLCLWEFLNANSGQVKGSQILFQPNSAPGGPEWTRRARRYTISILWMQLVLRGLLLPPQLLRIMKILPLLLVMVRRPLLLLHAGLHVSVAEVLGRLRRHLRQRLLLLGRGRRSVLGRRGRRRVLAELGPHGTAPDGMNLARHAERSVARRASAADSTGRWRLRE